MFVTQLLRPKFMLALFMALAIGSAAYGFAASNTFADDPTFVAGDAQEAISGYTIDDVAYTYTDVSNIDKVAFTLTGDAAPTSVKVQLVDGGAWYTATLDVGTWTANPDPDVSVSESDYLRIVAHN